MPVKVPVTFINPFQKEFFYSEYRNQCASGGFGNGKTFICCEKVISLAAYFSNYRVAILRRSSTDLAKTTRVTFYKVCPPELYDESRGGFRSDARGTLRLTNGSEILFLHLDDYDDNVVRGLEINTAFIDQAEEIGESVYDQLDARIGRWDMATLPDIANPDDYPKNPNTGAIEIPSYMLIACNPDSFDHWIYRKYHPESEDHKEKRTNIRGKEYSFSDTHKMYQATTMDNPALKEELIDTLLTRDTAFVNRFVKGIWGITEGMVHTLNDLSVLDDIPPGLYQEFIEKGELVRVMDYGAASPTSVLWFSAYKDWYLCYREYYKERTLISEHRANIEELGIDIGNQVYEKYKYSLADPSIFAKNMQKHNRFWSVDEEFKDMSMDAPPIHWIKANNDEFMTRNRIDELLRVNKKIKHPITKELGSPRLFFLKKSPAYPNACHKIVQQIQTQRRKQIDMINGQPIFSDERMRSVEDHAYDCLRYYAGSRPIYKELIKKRIVPGSFMDVLGEHKRKKYSRSMRVLSGREYNEWYDNIRQTIQ